MSENTYNGWRNWETWACNLWLDNEPSCYYDIQEMTADAARELVTDGDRYDAEYIEVAINALANNIEAYVTDSLNNLQAEVDRALAAAGLSYVRVSVKWGDISEEDLRNISWYDIAKSNMDKWISENPPEIYDADAE